MWKLVDSDVAISTHDAVEMCSSNARAGLQMTSFERADGATLIYLENRTRALLVLIDPDGEPSGQLMTPGAVGISSGYVLDNGQVDEYPDSESAPIDVALRALHHLIERSVPPVGVCWSNPV